MAVNRPAWKRNNMGLLQPYIFPGLVQAGSTQAIKVGEICAYNKTSGYWIPVSAVADAQYPLAICNQEQKADDLARYIEFIAPREGDEFEFEIDASAQVQLGYAYSLTASNSQKLTYDADGIPVAVGVNRDNYPETGTTLGYRSYDMVEFLPQVSFYYTNIKPLPLLKHLNLTAAHTIRLDECGKVFTNLGASGGVTLTGPSGTVPVGFHFWMVCEAADAMVFDPKPDTASLIVKGAAQTAGLYASITDEGDFIHWMWDGTNWVAIESISGADGDISIESP